MNYKAIALAITLASANSYSISLSNVRPLFSALASHSAEYIKRCGAQLIYQVPIGLVAGAMYKLATPATDYFLPTAESGILHEKRKQAQLATQMESLKLDIVKANRRYAALGEYKAAMTEKMALASTAAEKKQIQQEMDAKIKAFVADREKEFSFLEKEKAALRARMQEAINKSKKK